jgi:hypothetical protein
VCRVEAGHHHAALTLPGLSACAEHAACEAEFGPDFLEAGRAPKAVGPIA